jgi:hypothetical protein
MLAEHPSRNGKGRELVQMYTLARNKICLQI